MCGRYTFKMTWAELRALMAFTLPEGPDKLPFSFPPHYNICPTQKAPIARRDSAGVTRLELATWGLMPHWADKPGPVNARAESLAEKPMFRAALQKRRCIVPASGFYEWQAIEGKRTRQPWYIHRADDQPLLLAGLYEHRQDSGPTYTIITTPASDFIAPLHDRMPAILEPESVRRWLDEPDTALLAPAAPGVLTAHKVGARVNSPRNDDAALIEPATPQPPSSLFE
jgi:putative SOS response-associated peptidase YedK